MILANRELRRRRAAQSTAAWLLAISLIGGVLFAATQAQAAVCTEVAAGLHEPIGIVHTPQGRLLVAEAGRLGAPHSGRLSIIEADGTRRNLLDGLPSGTSDVGGVSGITGLLLRGRTLYAAIGVGDVAVIGRNPATGAPVPGSSLPNPAGPSSPLFSSVLAVQFSAAVEHASKGFTMTLADQHWLAAGNKLELDNGGGDKISIERVADLPNYLPAPHPVVVGNIKSANPFALAVIGDQLHATDGGRNVVWRIDLASGSAAPLTQFPAIANPLFGSIGGPTLDAVPTGIAEVDGNLLVALFRGAPFPPGVSAVHRVDTASGSDAPLITGLKTAIDVKLLRSGAPDLLVLQHASAGLFFGGPGQVLHYASPSAPPRVVADCLTLPVAMALDQKSGKLFVSELAGRVVSVSGW